MDKKETIINSAIELFSLKGYEGTSVRDIAADAGINVAMINYYFGSKEKLFESIVEHRASFLKGVFEELINNKQLSGIEKMDIIIDNTIERKFSGLNFHHIMHRELALQHRPQLKEAISDILLRNVTSIKNIIEEGISNGEFKQVDIELTLTTLLGTIHYLLTSDTLCRKILGKPKSFKPYQNKNLKDRISIYIKNLMRDHLLKK
ncbi:MAG: TetR/AcrR family transcriptional regulator [Bacteroidetes bacterium]|nr:TetR/AcrR family transcriptional regulator [Bacteroidota bacterium]